MTYSLNSFLVALLISMFGLALTGPAHAQDRADTTADEVFVVVSSGEAQTQMMAMVLATQMKAKGASVRILLCDAGGTLAVEGASFPTFKPANRGPQELLQGLMQKSTTVEVCAIFLPNTEYEQSDLLDGISVAKPGPVAEYMMKPNVRYFTF